MVFISERQSCCFRNTFYPVVLNRQHQGIWGMARKIDRSVTPSKKIALCNTSILRTILTLLLLDNLLGYTFDTIYVENCVIDSCIDSDHVYAMFQGIT